MTDINANIHLKSEQDPKAKTILILLLCSEQNFLGTIVKCMNFILNAHESALLWDSTHSFISTLKINVHYVCILQ